MDSGNIPVTVQMVGRGPTAPKVIADTAHLIPDAVLCVSILEGAVQIGVLLVSIDGNPLFKPA